MEEDKKAIPFKNMVYFGDGLTDVPCMKLVKDNGGTAVAVHKDKEKLSTKLLNDGRVNITAPADYEEGSKLDIEIHKVLSLYIFWIYLFIFISYL